MERMYRSPTRRWNNESHPNLQTKSSIMNIGRSKSVRLHGFQQKRALKTGGLRTVEMNYLKFAAEGDVQIVEKMFKKYTDEQLNRNCSDYFERTALTLAITNHRDDMIQYLLKCGVELTESLFYAIDNEYTEAVEYILSSDAHKNIRSEMLITSEESIFPRFLSPIMLAAHKNNYEILEILYSYGHRLRDHSVNTRNKWDEIRLKWLYYKARASQAYMILMFNKEKVDPLNEAIDFYGTLSREGIRSREVRENYKELASQCEDFAIALLNQLRTAQELADLLRFALVGREHGNANQLAVTSPMYTSDEAISQRHNSDKKTDGSVLDDWPGELTPADQPQPSIRVSDANNGGTLGRRSELTLNATPGRLNLNLESQNDTAEWIRSVTNAQVATTPHMDTLRRMLTPTDVPAGVDLEQRRQSYVVEDIPEDRRRTLGIRRTQTSSVTLEYARPIHFLKPIEKAVDNGMVRLVTCPNSQLALTYLKDGLLFRDDSAGKCLLKKILTGLFFPIISFAFFICPNSKLGLVARNPTAKLWMEVASDICLICLLVLNLLMSEYRIIHPYAFSPVLIIAYFWMPGKFINLMFLSYHQGRRVLYSIWNWNDIATILLYTTYMVLSLYGYTHKNGGPQLLSENQWSPIPISDITISVVYILVFLRPLEILRVNRTFGPLQVSVDRMMRDVSKFFLLFLVIWFAFSSGTNTLFWRYTGQFNETTRNCSDKAADGWKNSDKYCCFEEEGQGKFTNLGASLQVHFWSIFGYSDDYDAWFAMTCEKNAEKEVTARFGQTLFAMYHIGTVLVLVNMLIAIMSGTLQKTIDDSDIQWQFHRTRVWIRFIRTGFYRPPPMNILPRPKEIFFIFQKIGKGIRAAIRCLRTCEDADDELAPAGQSGVELSSFKRGSCKSYEKEKVDTRLTRGPTSVSSTSLSVATVEETGSRYDVTLRKCVKRYLKTHVVQADEFADPAHC